MTKAITKRVYLSPPDVGTKERELVLAAIDSNWVAPIGPDLDAFEVDLGRASGRRCAVGLSSGTAGLHLCLVASGIERGDLVAVSTFTFVATANAVMYCGAEPVFIDCSDETWNLDPSLLEHAFVEAIAGGKRIKAVVAVDLYGQCCDYEAIEELCDRYGAILISDAAESLGARAFGRQSGSFGRAAVFSFNGNKIITTSGGGMVVTDDVELAARIRFLSTQAREVSPHYEHEVIGYNYRLSNLLAAFGRGQVATLSDKVAARGEVLARYRAAFATLPVEFMPIPAWSEPNNWLTCVLLSPASASDREQIRLALEAEDIESRPLWKPMHQQPVFRGARSVLRGVSDGLFARGLCLPSGSSLAENDQQRVMRIVEDLVTHGTSDTRSCPD